jgi:hypothetical protein
MKIDTRNPYDQTTPPFADVKDNRKVKSLEQLIKQRELLQQKLNDTPDVKRPVGRPPEPKSPGRPKEKRPVGRPKTKPEKKGKPNPVGRPKESKKLTEDDKVEKLLF